MVSQAVQHLFDMHHGRALWQTKNTMMTIGVTKAFWAKTTGTKMKLAILNFDM